MKNKGLYIHIPFCNKLCPYCSFCHYLIEYSNEDKYIDRLILEINDLKEKSFESIYIGGGTPNSLSDYNLERLLKSLNRFINESTSFTIEINPSLFNDNQALIFSKYLINRVSIGVQTFNKKLQDIIERYCTYDSINEIIKTLNNYNINDINLDLMYGIPSETLDDLKLDLKLYTSLNIKHISCYSLQIEEHTAFYNNNVKEMDQDALGDFYDYICSFLNKKGFIHYEVSNFAKENYESKHNLLYWKNEHYIGLGVSSSGYEDNIRYTNTYSLNNYCLDNNKKTKEVLLNKDIKEYYIILSLRLKEGIDLSFYKEEFKSDFLIEYKDIVNELISKNVANISNNHFYIYEKYFFILNQFLIKFLD